MISENFVFLAVIISAISGLYYIYQVVQARVKPNRATWLVLSIAPMVALGGEVSEGVGIRSLITFMSGFIPLLIFISSFINKESYWKLQKLDYWYAALAVFGLILWRITGEGSVAIVFAIFADLMAFMPTLLKAYKYPETENYAAFLGASVSALIGLLVLDTYSFADWAFPAYLLVVDLTMVYLVAIRGYRKK